MWRAATSVDRLRTALPRGDSRRAVITLMGGTAMAQALVILASPILTRLYSPAEFGGYSAAISVVGLMMVISSLCYQYAIVLPEDDAQAANVVGLCLSLTVGMGIAAGVVLWLTGDQILAILGVPGMDGLAAMLVIGQVAGAALAALTAWAVRTKAFSTMATNSLAQSGSMVGTQVVLGLAGAGATGLLLGAIAGYVAGGARLARSAWRTHAAAFCRISRHGISRAAIRYRRFAFLATPSSFLNTLGLRAPFLILVAVYGADAGGQFALADRVLSVPIALMAGAVGSVYQSRSAISAREGSGSLRSLFHRTTRSLTAISVVLGLAMAIIAPVCFGLIFGQVWTMAGLFVTVMVPWYSLMLISNPTGATLDVLERQDLALLREILRIVAFGAALGVIVLVRPSPLGAVMALSVAGSVTYVAYGLLSWVGIVLRERAEPARMSDHTPVGSDPTVDHP